MNAAAKVIPIRREPEVSRHEAIRQSQSTQFWLLGVLPLVAAVPSTIYLAHTGLTKIDWFCFALMWLLSVIGIELGYHRHFSHNSFEAAPPLRGLLLVLGAMGGHGPLIAWASNHRYQHTLDGRKSKPAPVGFLHAHLFGRYEDPCPDLRYFMPALMQDALVLALDRLYYLWVVAGLLLPALLGGLLGHGFEGALTAFLFAGIIRLTVSQHAFPLQRQ